MQRDTVKARYQRLRTALFWIVSYGTTTVPRDNPEAMPFCEVCGRPALTVNRDRPPKGFQVHHIRYAKDTPIYTQYKNKLMYLSDLCKYARGLNPPSNEFALLCGKHHYAVEQMVRWPADSFDALAHLVGRTRAYSGKTTGGSIARRIAATQAALRARAAHGSAAAAPAAPPA